MENNDLFYEDTSRIPWYDINKSTDSTFLFNATINLPTAEQENNIDDSVIFVSESNANADLLSLSLSAKKKAHVKHNTRSTQKKHMTIGKKKKKYRNKKSKICKKFVHDIGTSKENDSEIIVVDEICTSPPVAKQQTPVRERSIDDSVIFVSETNVNDQFIPLSNPNSSKKKTKSILLRSAEKKITPQNFKRNLNALLRSTETKSKFKAEKLKDMLRNATKKVKPTLGVKKGLLNTPENNKIFTSDIQHVDIVEPIVKKPTAKRMVLIDGSNVAYKHSNDKYFSVEGLKICLEYFEKRGYDVKAVVPQFRFRKSKTNNSMLLEHLKNEGKIIITPSKHLPGNFSCSYDDRCIIQMACEMDAAIVSNDNYCDLINENDDFRKVIENRVIGYYWCNDLFMLPQDPYGRHGPTLNKILSH